MQKQKRSSSEASLSNASGKSKKLKNSKDEKKPIQHLIVCGSYEKAVFGFKLVNEEQSFKLEPLFVSMGHSSCVKAVAVSNHLVATSSTDETLKLYDLKKRVEVGTIHSSGIPKADGIITSIKFASGTHMITGTERGHLTIWRTLDWTPLVTLLAHRGAVNDIDIHPSAMLALSVSKDKTLQMLNLLKGKIAFTTKLEKVGEIIKWNPSASYFAIVFGSVTRLFNAKDGQEIGMFDNKNAIMSLLFIDENTIVVGGESEFLRFWKIEKLKNEEKLKATQIQEISAHKNRVKAVAKVTDEILVSVSSDGLVKVWNISNINQIKLIAEHSTNARLTCTTCAHIQ